MLNDVSWLVKNIKNQNPFAFSRFNDGEMMAIEKVGCVVARGDQYVDRSCTSKKIIILEFRARHVIQGTIL